jgi:hypothetical protein
LLYFGSTGWLIPALASYAVLTIFIYHGNKHVSLVPWSKAKAVTTKRIQFYIDGLTHASISFRFGSIAAGGYK